LTNENGSKELNDFDLTNFKDINDSILNSNSNDYSEKFQQVYKQFSLNLSVGNVSKNYIKKVVFYLHSSYKPYDVVEVK